MLDLLPRKVFELTLSDGSKVRGQFGTWALKRFTDKKNIPLSKVSEAFNNLTLDDAIMFVLCAIEYVDRTEGRALKFSDMDLCRWIDDSSDLEVLAKLIAHASDELPPPDEKKNQELSGEMLSDTLPVRA